MRGLWILMVGACGGVSESTPINDLDEDDWAKLCAELTVGATEREQDCGGYVATEPPYTAADCEADVAFYTAGCTAVVGDWQTCMRGVLEGDMCNPQPPSACAIVDECYAF